jgi:hypothetical protein
VSKVAIMSHAFHMTRPNLFGTDMMVHFFK